MRYFPYDSDGGPPVRCCLCGQPEDMGHTLRACLACRRWTRRFAGLLAEALGA